MLLFLFQLSNTIKNRLDKTVDVKLSRLDIHIQAEFTRSPRSDGTNTSYFELWVVSEKLPGDRKGVWHRAKTADPLKKPLRHETLKRIGRML